MIRGKERTQEEAEALSQQGIDPCSVLWDVKNVPLSSGGLEWLGSTFRSVVQATLEACAARGVELITTATHRSVVDQAELFCRGRKRAQLAEIVRHLQAEERDAEAFLLDAALSWSAAETGERLPGKVSTNALPSETWHAYGKAVDVAWIVHGRAEWSTERLVNGVNGYRVFRSEATSRGLHIGPSWDWCHIQQERGSPFGSYPKPGRYKLREAALRCILSGEFYEA